MLCVCVHVYVSMLIQGRALPNTPWKHSIHQQLEAGALGPALHLHWERGQRRGGVEEHMRLPQGREEGHSSEYLCICHQGLKDCVECICGSVEVLMCQQDRKSNGQQTASSCFFPGDKSLMDNWYLSWTQTDRYLRWQTTQKQNSWMESQV